MIFGREPALVLGLVGAVVSLAVGFGLGWSGEQVSLVMAAASALLSVLTRTLVSPSK